MSKPRQSWSVFIPCFNESNSLLDVVEGTSVVMNEIASEYEIVVVDDGSTDDSNAVIKELVKSSGHVSGIFHDANYGIGSVQRLAYTTAKLENVIIISGDGQFDPNELKANSTIEPFTWLSFYREQFPSYTLFRKILSGINKIMNKYLCRLEFKDVNWVMAFKTSDLKRLDLQMKSTLIKSEVCIKLSLLGHKVIEVPSTYHPRKSGQAKGASFNIIRQAALEIIKLFIVVHRFKRK